MTIPASEMLVAASRAIANQHKRDRISVGQGKLREDKCAAFFDAGNAAYEVLQRALADQLRSETE